VDERDREERRCEERRMRSGRRGSATDLIKAPSVIGLKDDDIAMMVIEQGLFLPPGGDPMIARFRVFLIVLVMLILIILVDIVPQAMVEHELLCRWGRKGGGVS
jgi:hypothetical protein